MQNRKITTRYLSQRYSKAHNLMRNIDGLQPQEAFDELLKYMFFKQINEERGPIISFQYQLLDNGSFGKEQQNTIKKLRSLFKTYLKSVNLWSNKIWPDKSFHLSDRALFKIHELFQEIEFSSIPFDTRSEAIKQFIPPEIRRGLGIFLTPDSVVKMMVEIVRPELNSRVYDIAVGSGTFLIEVVRFWQEINDPNKSLNPEVWGSDKNPRMLLLADLNLGHLTDLQFNKKLMDSLFEAQSSKTNEKDWPKPNYYDYIFTNPPFGVNIDSTTYNFDIYNTCKNKNGNNMTRQQSEVVFIEQSLKLLKPGGTLAIVLPKSIATNATLEIARSAINTIGYVYAIVILPPETFQTAGTQTTTILLFLRKFLESENRNEKAEIRLARITNVGYDATGRRQKGNQLEKAARDIKKSMDDNVSSGFCELVPNIKKSESIINLPSILFGTNIQTKGKKLNDVIECSYTGKTPARKSYSNKGLFLIKVGNLTGQGISWVPRDRNYIQGKEVEKRHLSKKDLMVKLNDILLTSSAHSPKYIAKKIDIVSFIPDYAGGEASFVGEVMLLRPKISVIDPYVLLAFLRMPETTEKIRQMIRGQTAHLHATDLLELTIPDRLFSPDKKLLDLADILRKEARLNQELNKVVYQKNSLIELIND